MEFRGWAHPFDARGNRRPCREIPHQLAKLRDDPYRSFANRVHAAGGYAKSPAPFAEFLWADFFRKRVSATALRRRPPVALRAGLRLAKSSAARYLPGWAGRAS